MEGTDKSKNSSKSLTEIASKSLTKNTNESLIESTNKSSIESSRKLESDVLMDSNSDSPITSERVRAIPINNKKKKKVKNKKSRRSRRYEQQNKSRKKQKERDNLRKESDVTTQNMYDNRTMGIPSVQEQRKRSEQGAIDIRMKHFGFYTDPKYTIKDNIRHLILTNDPLNLPRKPRNLKIHNLCTNPKALSKEILETLGLNLGHGIAMPIKKTNPIDFERLRRTIRLKYVAFPPEDPNNRYNPKLRVASLWNPPDAPRT